LNRRRAHVGGKGFPAWRCPPAGRVDRPCHSQPRTRSQTPP
jgi:hypothetical protein